MILGAIGKVFLFDNRGHTSCHSPCVNPQQNSVNAPDWFLGNGMSPEGQSVSDSDLAGPCAFADLLQPDSILARIATADHTESEVGNAIILLIEASKQPVCVMHDSMSLGPVRARCSVLSAPYIFLCAPTPDAGPLLKVSREMMFASGLPRALAPSSGPRQAGNGLCWQKPGQTLGSHPQ